MKKILIILLITLSSQSFATLKILTTTPDIAWLVKEVGGERVRVESLLDGSEDPHYVDAMPHWIAKTSRADIFCQVGLELEIGWAPKVLSRSGNPKVQPGQKGFCDLGKFISALDIPKGKVDRSMGDMHPGGNPHYHLGPSRFIQAAEGVFEILVSNDASGLDVYTKNLANTKKRIGSIKEKALVILKNVKSKKLMSYHNEFSYFIEEFGLSYIADVESTPGVPPSAGRLARVGIEAKSNKVDLLIASKNNPEKILKKFKEISGVPYSMVNVSIKENGPINNYEKLILTIAKTISGN